MMVSCKFTSEEGKRFGWHSSTFKRLNEAQKYPYLEVLKDGKVVGVKKRIRFGEEDDDWSGESGRCHDCGTKVGCFHGLGCDVERNPVDGSQLLISDNVGNFVSISKKKLKEVM